jgi:hypothetical protein
MCVSEIAQIRQQIELEIDAMRLVLLAIPLFRQKWSELARASIRWLTISAKMPPTSLSVRSM